MHTSRNIAIPAPFPGYVLAVFLPFAILPFMWSSIAWVVVSALAGVATFVNLRRLTRLDVLTLGTVVFTAAALPSIMYGNVTILAVAGLTYAGVALEERRPWMVALGLSVAALEPHVALAAIVGVFIWERRCRIPIAVACMAMSFLTFLTTGTFETLEYVRNVLPAHALTELANGEQLALSAILHQLGVNAHASVTIGNAQYAIFFIASIVTAGGAARTAGRSAFAFWPCAAVIVGGTFVHATQIAFALPLAVTLFENQNVRRGFAGAALIAIGVPWLLVVLRPEIVGVGAFTAFLVARRALHFPFLACALVAGAPLAAMAFGVILSHGGDPIDWSKIPASVYAPATALAESSWRVLMDAYVPNGRASFARLLALASMLVPLLAVATSQTFRPMKLNPESRSTTLHASRRSRT